MDDQYPSVDDLEQTFEQLETGIAALRARQLELIRRLDVAQVASMDACRTLQEWLGRRFDLRRDTAADLVRLARVDHELLEKELAEGLVTTDRAVAETKLIATGATDDQRLDSRRFDLHGVARLTGRRRRVTSTDEHDAHRNRHMIIQRELDGTRGRFWGEAPAFDLDVIEHALQQRADALFQSFPNRPGRPIQHLDALVSLAQDALVGTPAPDQGTGRAKTVAVVTVDAGMAAPTDGEAGAEMLTGGRVGPATLDRIRCTGLTEVNVRHPNGTTCHIGPTTGPLSPRQVRRILARDNGQCQIDGCTSTYGLEPHHITWRVDGGTNDDDNLVTLCWVHHHRYLHGEGRRLDPKSPRTRLQFLRRVGPAPPRQLTRPSPRPPDAPTRTDQPVTQPGNNPALGAPPDEWPGSRSAT